MAQQRRLSHDDRVRLVVLRDVGYSVRQIAARVKCSPSTVSKTLKRLAETGGVDDRSRSGRPKISSARQDRALVNLSLKDRRKTSVDLKKEWEEASGVVCSTRTVRRRLDKAGLYGRVARKKPLLTDRHKKVRLAWAKERKNWTTEDWNKVVWSYESKFNLFGSDGRVYIRRRKGEEFLPQCVHQTVKFGGGSVMMWGCISCDGVGRLAKVDGRMTAQGYISLLRKELLPFMTSLGPEFSGVSRGGALGARAPP